MNDAKQQVVDRLKQANNILVTVRTNPTVDLLSACIGLALALDKLDKHAAAVFSGKIPSTIEFLKPQETLEPTPDSLRDFIIALDKSKADKLRYKVEDKVVRIFITPYRTSITQDDLQFSQGDFNVDVVVALGAHEQHDLDEAITVHGRILHDATVVSINNTPDGNLGAIAWQDTTASSVSELVTEVVEQLGQNLLDGQIATALLTGIVAETVRFSNDKTTPKTMDIAGDLMAAGANQQLVASQLQADVPKPAAPSAPQPDGSHETDDGTLEVGHGHPESVLPSPPLNMPPLPTEPPTPPEPSMQRLTTERTLLPTPSPSEGQGALLNSNAAMVPDDEADTGPSDRGRAYLLDEPTFPASTPKPPDAFIEPSNVNPTDVLPVEPPAPLLGHSTPSFAPPSTSSIPSPGSGPAALPPSPSQPYTPSPSLVSPFPAPPAPVPPVVTPPEPPAMHPQQGDDRQTLEEIEESVHSPHLQLNPDIDVARSQVLEALKQGPQPLEPLASLNANPLGNELHPEQPVTPPSITVDEEGNIQPLHPENVAPTIMPPPPPAPASTEPDQGPALPSMDMPLPNVASSAQPSAPSNPPGGPPPVPPPLPPNLIRPGQ